MTTIVFALRLLLAAIILFPFVCFLGIVWIAAYFTLKKKEEKSNDLERTEKSIR